MWKFNLTPEEQFSWVCKALLPLKSKTDPPEEGVGLLIQAECLIGVHVPGPGLGHCFQPMTLFRAALHASQKTGASALWCGSGMKGYVFLLC